MNEVYGTATQNYVILCQAWLFLVVGKETLSRVLVARPHRLLDKGQHRVSVDFWVFLCSVFKLVLFFTPLYFCFRSFGSVFPDLSRG